MQERNYNFVMIPLHIIRPPTHDIRENMSAEGLDDLQIDILKNGIINPITVKNCNDGFYEVVAGHRRYLCAQRLHLSEVPCIIRAEDDKTLEILKLSENEKREDVNPYDLGKYFQILIQVYGLTMREIAESSNRSEGYVRSRLDLLAGDYFIAEAVRDGFLGIGVALKLNEIRDEKIRRYYTTYAIDSGASLRNVEGWIREANSGVQYVPSPTVPVTDPNSEFQPNRLVYICEFCGGEIGEGDLRTVSAHSRCKYEVVKACRESGEWKGKA